MDPEKNLIFFVTDDSVLEEEARSGFPQVFDVVTAQDARDAWKQMVERPPVVAVIEIRTGSAGGFGLARDMSQHRKLREVPILMLIEREQDRWLAETAGAREVLVQPVDAADLADHTLALLTVEWPRKAS